MDYLLVVLVSVIGITVTAFTSLVVAIIAMVITAGTYETIVRRGMALKHGYPNVSFHKIFIDL